MIDALTNDPAVAQYLRLILGIVFFALIGATYTVWAAYRNGERWQSSKAKTEIATLAIAGAAAGIYTMFVGADIGSVVFGSAVGVAGHVLREGIEIYGDTRDRYDELSEHDLDPTEAAFLSFKHGLEENNPDEVIESVRTLMELGGRPSRATAEQRAADLEGRAREDGPRSAVDSMFPEEDGAYYGDEEAIREGMGEDYDAGEDEAEAEPEIGPDDGTDEDVERRQIQSPTSERSDGDGVVRDGP